MNHSSSFHEESNSSMSIFPAGMRNGNQSACNDMVQDRAIFIAQSDITKLEAAWRQRLTLLADIENVNDLVAWQRIAKEHIEAAKNIDALISDLADLSPQSSHGLLAQCEVLINGLQRSPDDISASLIRLASRISLSALSSSLFGGEDMISVLDGKISDYLQEHEFMLFLSMKDMRLHGKSLSIDDIRVEARFQASLESLVLHRPKDVYPCLILAKIMIAVCSQNDVSDRMHLLLPTVMHLAAALRRSTPCRLSD